VRAFNKSVMRCAKVISWLRPHTGIRRNPPSPPAIPPRATFVPGNALLLAGATVHQASAGPRASPSCLCARACRARQHPPKRLAFNHWEQRWIYGRSGRRECWNSRSAPAPAYPRYLVRRILDTTQEFRIGPHIHGQYDEPSLRPFSVRMDRLSVNTVNACAITLPTERQKQLVWCQLKNAI